MKSVTVTTLRTINFGAVLQSYALNKAQRKLGIENYVLDTSEKKNLYGVFPKRLSKLTIITLANNIIRFFHKKEMLDCLNNFHTFISNNIDTTKKYDSYKMIAKNPPKADFYINGSDQVFGLRGEYDKERMLQFGSEDMLRYSYAASLGEYDWNETEKKRFAGMLRGFSMISVREKYAKEYIEEFANDVHCEVHMDPVFLLTKEEWKCVATARLVKEDYILCYPLIGNEDTQKALDELKKKTGLKVVCVQIFPIKRVKADEYIFDAGPAEFLSLFLNASYVVTTSFHGTAFSLIFEKPFYTMIKNYKSQRMTDLLEMVDLSDRIYSSKTTVSDELIDFSRCRDIIASERAKGYDYLRKVMEDVNRTKGDHND